ncbi:uncharacterized protein LOC109808591 [Cajanus cajan]|uniref:uncharacterized protein LOC109808591 n=1 Tax=Cajanus cajan TaxID=3821 RepID=UPI00098DB20E|nr:uncharacterized protein LOC109808591 [Cajanus cajan]
MDRFNKAALEIRDLNPAVALHHLTTALKPGPFVNSICKKPPSDMNDLRRRADKYMQMEELAEYRNQARAEPSNKPEKQAEQPYRGRGKDISLRDRPTRGPKYTHYTPLNTSRAAVLEQALASEVLVVPKRASTPPRADTSKSCRYHRNRGHSTDECAALKDKIENLIKQGKLHNFVDRPGSSQSRSYQPRYQDWCGQDSSDRPRREQSRSRERKDDSAPSHRRVINTIAGGFAGGGTTSSAQKRHLRAVRSINAIDRQPSRRLPTITFTDADFQGIDPVQDDPMVISVEIHNCIVKKTLIDQGSSADILYWNTFKQLGISEKELIPYDDPLVGFAGERVSTKGYIKLFTRFCFDQQESREIQIKYIVVNANTSYNILLGQPSLNMLGAIVSTPHLAMKFPFDKGKIVTIHADQKAARECYYAILRVAPIQERNSKSKRIHAVNPSVGVEESIWDLDPRMKDEERVEPVESKRQLQIGLHPTQVTYIGADISEADRSILSQVIIKNKDLFAWTPSDMPGIDPKVMCHKLSICAEARPVAQRKRKMGTERKLAVETEVAKLLEAGFIREVHYTTWLANVVMVKKPNGKWRICTDYTNLNKACPKDAYPLPNIDRLVDGAFGHGVLTFLDAYSGYNQIPMHPRDEEKTAFITDSANYCYQVMPFGLKNAGGKFLGFMLSARGIEANPDKCMAVINMVSPRNLKEVQKLAGRLTALSQFLPCLAEIAKPIVGLLRKVKKFEWSIECEEAFRMLKERLGSPPVLSKPHPQVDMIVYLCVSNEAISAVLIQKVGGQQPIYFISRMLQEAETRYQLLEKVALGLVHAARRLRQYFRHRVVVRTDCPITKVLRKPELAGRMMAWSIELSEFDISFEARGPVKSQFLAYFVNELQPRGHFVSDLWTMHVDGSSNSQGSGAGIILEGPTGLNLEQSLRFAFKASNNQAEYEALLAGLRLAQEIRVRRLICWPDPKVVAEQVEYVLREIHEGICGFHSGGRTLATKVLRAGYYWPTLKDDCVKFAKRCVSCQRHSNLIHASAEELHGIS